MFGDAAELYSSNKEEAVKQVLKLGQLAKFVGTMLAVSGCCGKEPAADLAAEYMGALAIEPQLETETQRLSAAAFERGGTEMEEVAPLLRVMLAMIDPASEGARKAHAEQLERVLASADFGETAGTTIQASADALELPLAVSRKLAADVYYGWLLDLSERDEKSTIGNAEKVCECFGLDEQ